MESQERREESESEGSRVILFDFFVVVFHNLYVGYLVLAYHSRRTLLRTMWLNLCAFAMWEVQERALLRPRMPSATLEGGRPQAAV